MTTANTAATLSASMLTRASREMRTTTKQMALTLDGKVVSPNASKIEAMLKEARLDLGYNRPEAIRVERPEDTAPGTLMGRFRVKVPMIDGPRD